MKRYLVRTIALVFVLILAASCGSTQPTPNPASALKTENETLDLQTEAHSPQENVDPTPIPTETGTDQSDTPTLQTSNDPVNQLAAELEGLSLADFFEVSTRALTVRSPETVLSMGLSEHYGITEVELDDISDSYQRETYAMTALVLEKMGQYDRAALAPEEQISYDIYAWDLEDRLARQEFMYHDYPATYFPVTAVHEDILYFFTDIHPVSDLEDAQDYVTRLGLVDAKIAQLIEGLELRAAAGIEPPEFAIQWATYGSLGQFVDRPARATPLYTTLKEKLDLLSSGTPEDKQVLLDQAEGIIAEEVLPAYRELRDDLNRLPVYRGGDSGVWRLPQGDEYYNYCLRHSTTTDLSADEIHQLGLDELARIQAEMRTVFDQLGYPQDDTLVEAFDRVAVDGGHISGSDVLTTYEDLISEAEASLDAAFDIRPAGKVVVIGDDFGGFYVRGSMDGSRPGAFYAAVGGAGEPYYAMPTLAYHEAIPGHHFQLTLAMEMEDLPSFRRGLSFTAFAEGWALYAENLAWELGWYEDDPYGYLGMLQGQAFRAARLVVDTGLHAKGWTFDQAQEFFTENTGFEVGDPVNPQHQIARYLVWPGQATSYYVGYLQFMELRQRAMDQLGDQFDLKEFHRLVLSNGSMPLEILERVVEQYIQEKLRS